MVVAMTMVKKVVMLDADLVAAADELAGRNFSAFINVTLERAVRQERLRRLVERDRRERGSVDPEVQAAINAELAAAGI
jgi:carbamate kinase